AFPNSFKMNNPHESNEGEIDGNVPAFPRDDFDDDSSQLQSNSEWGVTLVLRVDWELDVGLAIPEP
ncbi:unnamed protein product, partial [Sphenostylis stenocarpa]